MSDFRHGRNITPFEKLGTVLLKKAVLNNCFIAMGPFTRNIAGYMEASEPK